MSDDKLLRDVKDGDVEWTIDCLHGSYWWEVWQWGVTENYNYYFKKKFSGQARSLFWAKYKARGMAKKIQRGEWA